MWTKRLRWAAALGALFGSATASSHLLAQAPGGRVVIASTEPTAVGRVVPKADIQRPVPVVERTATMSTQEPSTPPPPPVPPLIVPPAPVSPVGYQEPLPFVRAQASDTNHRTLYGPPPVPPPGGDVVPTPPFGAPEGHYDPSAPFDHPLPRKDGFWDRCRDWFSSPGGHHGHGWCESDHGFDTFISPVTNPFFTEDPRALTEVRPLFIAQNSPGNSPIFAGGKSYFLGVQGRVAFTEQWSLVINKFGFVSFDPKLPNGEVDSESGFAEINIGPKWTFIHNPTTKTVGAVGMNFELPLGSKHVLQDTGTLSIDPYFSFAQGFGRTSFGEFNFMGTVGYNFSVDDKRSEFIHAGLHLDYNVALLNKWYPLMELNWFHYTKAGRSRPLDVEGLDLGNFGSTGVSGHEFLSLAAGLRYKFSERVQLGAAAEFPLSKAQDIQDFRLTLDLIFRY